jgi:hypothetical protein
MNIPLPLFASPLLQEEVIKPVILSEAKNLCGE